MKRGPNYIYKCPNCYNLIQNKSLLSGNTLGGKFYSDGRIIAPMLPDIPFLTKCYKCNTIFWLKKPIGGYEMGDKSNLSWYNADQAEFLEIDDYFRALQIGIAQNKEEEILIRKQIWYAYNDRVRLGKEQFVNENDEKMWRENCQKLILLLDQSDIRQKIMIAELKRNLADFNGCLETIKKVNDKRFNKIKERIIFECEHKNNKVVEL
mgnify:CR=1 FL=1